MKLVQAVKERLRERLMRNVVVDIDSRCWLWQRRTNNEGYAEVQMRLDDYDYPVKVLGHRLSYHIFRRRPPRTRVIAHSVRCISKRCINPEHLRATTQSCNVRDRKRTTEWRRRQLRDLFPPTHFQEAA